MSLPPIPRAKSTPSLPSLPTVQSKPSGAAPSLAPATRKEARQAATTGKKEILAITIEDDAENPDAISVSFSGAGFDIENDEIVLDLLRLAVNSYGYDIFEMPDLEG